MKYILELFKSQSPKWAKILTTIGFWMLGTGLAVLGFDFLMASTFQIIEVLPLFYIDIAKHMTGIGLILSGFKFTKKTLKDKTL